MHINCINIIEFNNNPEINCKRNFKGKFIMLNTRGLNLSEFRVYISKLLYIYQENN